MSKEKRNPYQYCKEHRTISVKTTAGCPFCLQAQLTTANKEIKRLREALEEIEAVACGETQIDTDGSYDDGDGMKWIYDRTQALKGE